MSSLRLDLVTSQTESQNTDHCCHNIYCLLLIIFLVLVDYRQLIETQQQPQVGLMFVCKRCLKEYKHKPSIYKHLRFECGVEPQFKCTSCPYRSKQAGNMRLHELLKHPLQ